jgi:hypothetical protein
MLYLVRRSGSPPDGALSSTGENLETMSISSRYNKGLILALAQFDCLISHVGHVAAAVADALAGVP